MILCYALSNIKNVLVILRHEGSHTSWILRNIFRLRTYTPRLRSFATLRMTAYSTCRLLNNCMLFILKLSMGLNLNLNLNLNLSLNLSLNNYIFLLYCPPTENKAFVICPKEQYLTHSINCSKIFSFRIEHCCSFFNATAPFPSLRFHKFCTV